VYFQIIRLSLLLKGLGNLFAMCYSPNKLDNVSIIFLMGVSRMNNLVPAFGDWVVRYFVEIEGRTMSGGIQKQVHASFPFEQADLCARTNPLLIQDSRKENRAINGVYQYELIFDYIRRVLGSSGTVD
jgi:hypothetical protein